jgi:hypothetical protein
MSDRVSDLVFRDLDSDPEGASPSDDEREATLREELFKLHAADTGPRVIPAARAAERTGKRPR